MRIEPTETSTALAPEPSPIRRRDRPAPAPVTTDHALPRTRTGLFGAAVEALLPFLLALAAFLPALGSTPLAGTEGHRAVTAHQMVVSGRWLLPMMYDRLYLRKPPLHYWILATFEKVTGQASEWVWRLPASLAAAATASLVALFARRWFGQGAGLTAGLACVALVPLWPQSRSADIDALNTLAATASALLLIECAAATQARDRGSWTLAAGMAVGVALLLKGPAALPVVLGAAIEPLTRRRADAGRRGAAWLPILIGVGLFAAYAFAALLAIRHRAGGGGADLSGLTEAADNLVPDGAGRLLRALLVPPSILLYGLPVSLCLIPALLWWRDPATPGARRVRALTVTFALALLICLLSGMINPRYAYPALPLLCPIAGAVVVGATCDVRRTTIFRATLAGAAIAFAGMTVALSAATWRADPSQVGLARPILLSTGAVLLGATVMLVFRQPRDRSALVSPLENLVIPAALAALLLLAAAAYRPFMDASRERRSGRAAGEALRQAVGAGTRVATGRLLGAQPEIFLYGKVDVQSLGDDIARDLRLPAQCWAVLTRKEWEACVAADRGRFSQSIPLPTDGPKPVLVWVER